MINGAVKSRIDAVTAELGTTARVKKFRNRVSFRKSTPRHHAHDIPSLRWGSSNHKGRDNAQFCNS
jgi:hypothetical protein